MDTLTVWQVLFVDDDPETCALVKEFLDGEVLTGSHDQLHTDTFTSFDQALEEMDARRYDFVILDVRRGPHDQYLEEEVGIITLEAIRQRRFVPVVFYSGLPRLVRHLETPLIRVVEKGQLPFLLDTIGEIVRTRIPSVNRALIHHLELTQRDYMWDFVASVWNQFGDTQDRTALAYLLARRLAHSLSGPGIQQLAQELGDPTVGTTDQGRVHPMQYYVVPPIEPTPLAGDLLQGLINDLDGWWVILTPSCDLVAGREKAEWILLARCLALTDQKEYQDWQTNPSHPSKKLQSLLKNNRGESQPERFFFLPAALTLPGLVVDFQQLVTIPRMRLSDLNRLASLDSPFAEALLHRFGRYFGRLGTPDLDTDNVIARL
jgi:CheY-like chemotaxis protein